MGLIWIVSVDFNALRDGAILDGSYFYFEFRVLVKFRVVAHMAVNFQVLFQNAIARMEAAFERVFVAQEEAKAMLIVGTPVAGILFG